ncbi:MAG TPA: chorismate-binding protein [Prolixibacteraceae bacterium]|nr:chorismate-binding protein [Prolixibacteraceae bacterium]
MDFFQAIQYCVDNNLTFAAYRLPHNDAVRLVVQRTNKPVLSKVNSELFTEKGFLIAPFTTSHGGQPMFIHADLNYISTDYINFDELTKFAAGTPEPEDFSNGVVSRNEFIKQVNEIKWNIKSGSFEKVVLSRIKIIERNYRAQLTKIFQQLTASYSNAFVYLYNSGGKLWMGATPEPLLCSHRNELQTVSLASTRRYSAENLNLHNWDEKERDEQNLVTCYIEKALENFRVQGYSKTGPYTKKAGNLVHLRTDFSLDYHEVNGQLGNLLSELHPTSAVCGLPKNIAMDYLLKTEKHNRSYYSGYLGPVNLDERMLLFVNLRCMQVLTDKLVLYVGAGITSESIAEDEWDETEIKADTLLSVIYNV